MIEILRPAGEWAAPGWRAAVALVLALVRNQRRARQPHPRRPGRKGLEVPAKPAGGLSRWVGLNARSSHLPGVEAQCHLALHTGSTHWEVRFFQYFQLLNPSFRTPPESHETRGVGGGRGGGSNPTSEVALGSLGGRVSAHARARTRTPTPRGVTPGVFPGHVVASCSPGGKYY